MALLISVFIFFINYLHIFTYVGSNYEFNSFLRGLASKAIYLKFSQSSEEEVRLFIFKEMKTAEMYKRLYLIKIGSVYGLDSFDDFLLKKLKQTRRVDFYLDEVTTIIEAIGVIGKERNIENLKACKNFSNDKDLDYIINSFIESALYYSGCSDCEYSFIISDNQEKIRSAILKSRNRHRDYNEMVTIDGELVGKIGAGLHIDKLSNLKGLAIFQKLRG